MHLCHLFFPLFLSAASHKRKTYLLSATIIHEIITLCYFYDEIVYKKKTLTAADQGLFLSHQ